MCIIMRVLTNNILSRAETALKCYDDRTTKQSHVIMGQSFNDKNMYDLKTFAHVQVPFQEIINVYITVFYIFQYFLNKLYMS